MYTFTPAQQRKALVWLSFSHILVIAASNYLVQFPFELFGFHTTWGAFTFPFIFLTTDLTVRIFGRQLARRIIFWVMLPALALSYTVSVWFSQGSWTGWAAIADFNSFVGRIALASFAAYAVGQLLDIFVFDKLRRLKAWWVAPAAFHQLRQCGGHTGFLQHRFLRQQRRLYGRPLARNRLGGFSV